MSLTIDTSIEKGYDGVCAQPEPVSRIRKLLERGARLPRIMLSALHVLQPVYLKRAAKTTKLRRTAYLDGIRGFAALLVYWLHHELWSHESQQADSKLESSWGYDGQHYFAAFPGIRTFFTGGHYAVATFFVLSGYVLSTKPLALINAGEHSHLGDTLASGLFRRWLRLYLPIICTTFFLLASWHVFGILADFVPESSYRAELWKWYLELKNFTYIFRLGGDPRFFYHTHTWSIPIEMRGSVVIYTVLLAFSRLTRKARLCCEGALTVYFLYIADGAHYAMFMAGMCICDLDYLFEEETFPSWPAGWERVRAPFFHVLLMISIYLGGVPSLNSNLDNLRDSPGWHYLSWLKPQAVLDYKWFYLFYAASILVFVVPRIAWLKRFFESRFCQYLGRISYMFYLLHGPVLWTLGDRLYAAVGWSKESHALTLPGWSGLTPIPAFGPLGMELNFFAPHLILLPVTLWMAEVATTLVDDTSIAFCAWLYNQVIVPPREKAVL
jgi:peptidoglycan/LPS O-acetylase OafA/YrhL